jgi:hypothetical protein
MPAMVEAAQVLPPLGHRECGDVAEGGGAPAGEDLVADVSAVVLVGAWLNIKCLDPDGGPVGEWFPGSGGVDPGAAAPVGVQVVGVVFGGFPGVEAGL